MALTDQRQSPRSEQRRPQSAGARRPSQGRPSSPARGSGPHGDGTPPDQLWARAALVLGALLAALAGIHVLVADLSWWFVGAAFATVVVGVATFVRTLSARRWLPPLVAIVVAIIGVTAGYASDVAFLGFLPSADAVDRLTAVSRSGFQSIANQAIPAEPQLGIVFLLALLMIGCALAAEAAAAHRLPALTAIPLLGLLVIPTAVRPELTDPVWFVVTAALYLLLLRSGRAQTSRRVFVVAGVAAIVGGLVTPSILPSVDPDAAATTGGLAAGVNPLINLGDDLRRGDPVVAVTYTTDSDSGLYLRLATLDSFNGRTWSPTRVPALSERTVDAFPPPAGLTDAVLRERKEAVVEVGNISGRWLPLPYPAQSVTGTEGDWFWEPDGLSARTSNSSLSGQTYSVAFSNVEPSLDQLQVSVPVTDLDTAPAEYADIDVLRYLGLPARMPQIITDTAAEIRGSLTSNYDIALALQAYFQDGDFEYSEDAPVEQGYDGSGTDVLAEFLVAKSGYCVHYSSAMAVMARSLGIPARIAVGFQPGEQSTIDGQPVYTVSSHDLHAWPELYFEGVGWLRFEPTPGRGEVPDYGLDAPVDDPATPENEALPATNAPSAAPTATAAPERPVEIDPLTGAPVVPEQAADPLPIVLLVMLGILLLAGLTPAAARALVRRRRYARVRRGEDAAAAAWDEVRDTARDHGWAAPDSETPRDFAERLAVVMAGSEATITGFRDDVELSAFAPPGRGSPTVEELRSVRRAIGATVTRRLRLRAVFLPTSLASRFRWDPDG